jgi:hypothetical protein
MCVKAEAGADASVEVTASDREQERGVGEAAMSAVGTRAPKESNEKIAALSESRQSEKAV